MTESLAPGPGDAAEAPSQALARENAPQAAEREQTAVSEAAGEPPAERPTPADENVGAAGMSLGGAREIGGGGDIIEHTPGPEPAATVDPLYFHRRYINSRLRKEAGDIIARSPENIGFWGKGMTYRGSGILIDIDTLQKHRFRDGWRFEGDEVYANSRDVSPSLVEGDVAKNLSGESAQAMADSRRR